MKDNIKRKSKRTLQLLKYGLPYISFKETGKYGKQNVKNKVKVSTNKKLIWVGYFPFHHRNMGDQAQTIAIEDYLHTYFDEYKIYKFNREEYGSDRWNKLEKDINEQDVIILSSTGDFGSRYIHQKKYLGKYSWSDVRRRIVQNFPNNKIIQLPVTVFYGDEPKDYETIEKDRSVYTSAKHFIILCRESKSCAILQNLNIGNPHNIHFFPDFVFYYKPQLHSFQRKGILLTLRDGDESALTEQDKKQVLNIIQKQKKPVDQNDIMKAPFPLYRTVRDKYLEKICREIQKYELVVTDRMHGMILAVITQTPCVVLDDAIPHKISGYESFLKGAVHFAHGINDLPSILDNVFRSEYQKIDFDHYFDDFRKMFVENDIISRKI